MQDMTITSEIETETKVMEVQVNQAIAAIADEKSCDVAADIARECANWIDKIEAELGPNRDDARGTYERLRDKIADYKKPYIEWKTKIIGAVATWRNQQRMQIERENRKRIEEAEREARAKAEREATKLEKKGHTDLAEAVRTDTPVIAPVLQEAPKNKGIVDKTTWVVDIFPSPTERWKLIKFLVEGGPQNVDALMINPSYLKKLAALRHEEMKAWPGITVRPVFSSEIRRDSRAR